MKALRLEEAKATGFGCCSWKEVELDLKPGPPGLGLVLSCTEARADGGGLAQTLPLPGKSWVRPQEVTQQVQALLCWCVNVENFNTYPEESFLRLSQHGR